MCGIVGAVAQRDVVPILVEGLRRLEYRGYDSAGVAVLDDKSCLGRVRTKGKVGDLRDQLYRDYTGLYGVLKKDSNPTAIDSLQNEICGVYRAINNENIAHFEDVKKLCREDQLKNFDIFLDEMLERLGPGRK